MTIRQAGLADVEHVAQLGHKFIRAAGMPPATLDQCRTFCETLIPTGGVFVSPQGVIAGTLAPVYYNPEIVNAVELFWWCEDGHGIELLAAFEAWASEQGCTHIIGSAIENYSPRAVEVLFRRRGYERIETTFRKVA